MSMGTVENQLLVLLKRIEELEKENSRLHETVVFLTHKLYGSKSEKTSSLQIEGQMSLFDEIEVSKDPSEPKPELKAVEAYHRKKAKGHKDELLKDLPHFKKLCTLDEQDRFCETCGSALYSVGEEFVRTEVEYIPAQIRVIDFYRETFECRECRKAERTYMEKSPMPDAVIQHSLASASTIGWIIHQKFELAVPLYRQEKEWEVLGLKLSRATMANWIMASYRDWLSPVVDLLKRHMLKQSYLHIDETPVQVMNETDRKNTRKSYMWVYSSIKESKCPIRYFEYQPGRSGQFPKQFLDGYQGFIHTDAYKGYEKVDGVTSCFCWTHLRRYFVDALPKDVNQKNTTIPATAIQYINKLFEIEKKLEVLSANGRKEQRLIQEKPVLDAFWSWAEEAAKEIPPRSKLGTAFTYAFNQKDGLMNYLEDGNCSISNL